MYRHLYRQVSFLGITGTRIENLIPYIANDRNLTWLSYDLTF